MQEDVIDNLDSLQRARRPERSVRGRSAIPGFPVVRLDTGWLQRLHRPWLAQAVKASPDSPHSAGFFPLQLRARKAAPGFALHPCSIRRAIEKGLR